MRVNPCQEHRTLGFFFLWMTVLVAVIVPALGAPSRAFAVLHSCTADALANTVNVLCASGTCTATLVRVTTAVEVTSAGCEFDLSGRPLRFEKTFQMTGLGFIRVINAGDITFTSTGKLKARGDFVRAADGSIIGGGLISLTSSGTIDIDGSIDVAGDSAGTVRLVATQDIILRPGATIEGPGITTFVDEGSRFTDGGELDATAQAGSITINGEILLKALNAGTGGVVDFTAGRNLAMTKTVDIRGGGGDGGEFNATVGDHITLTQGGIDADSIVGGGYGGVVSLDAGEDFLGGVVPGGTIDINSASFLMRGSATDLSGGGGGELELLASGRIRLFGDGMVIRASAATNFDGSGGLISIDSGDGNFYLLGPLDGDLEIDGLIFMQSGALGGDGGSIDLSAGRDLVFTATLDNSGTDTGGDVAGTAGRAITLNGLVTTRGTSAGGEGGYVDFEAGFASDEGALGTIFVQKNIVATSGADHGSGQSITLAGCGLTVSPNVKIDGTGGVNPITNMLGGSDIDLIARRPMQLGGSSQYVAPPGGLVTTIHPPGANPVIAAGVVFNPPRLDNPIAAGPYPNCPVCGDGIKQFGEICDGACCNATCNAFTCLTATPTPTLTVTRTPTPGRTATLTPTRTATPTVVGTGPTPTEGTPTAVTATITPAASSTATRTATPSPTGTPTAAPTATSTAAPTATSTAAPTATSTATSTAAPTAAPTATPAVTVVDHYKCYSARKASGATAFVERTVTLADEVETKSTRVLKTTEFCNAVDKDGQGIDEPNAHLQCYQVRDAPGQARFASSTETIDNDFGAGQVLALKKAKRLCVPAGRDGVPAAPNIDRFKCYSVKTPSGAPKFTPVNALLVDAFESKLATVQTPESICTTVEMDGQGTISPAAQLHCYKIRQASGQAAFDKVDLLAATVFGSESLGAQKPTLVCVPSTRADPAVCGDGFRDPGEECDDGGIIPGDGCDAQCRLESCGDRIINGGEECDDGVGNGTNECCSALCQLVDPDGDGLCTRDDRCPTDTDNDSDGDGYCVGGTSRPPAIGIDDPCSRVGVAGDWIKPKAVVSKLDQALGLQKLTAKGAFVIPTGGQPVAPQARGVHVRLTGPTGVLVLDEHIPGGFYSTVSPTGWKLGGDPPTKFTYLDKTVPPLRNGIKKLVITNKSSKVPGLITVVINGDRGRYPLAPGETPIAVAVELNDTGSPQGSAPGADQCGEVRFVLPPLAPTCSPSATKLSCK